MLKRRVKLFVILCGVSLIVFAAKCPWFHGMIDGKATVECVCEDCVEGCEHMNGEDCDCDGNCGCPMCVPAEQNLL